MFGEFLSFDKVILLIFVVIGGMVVSGLVYVVINWGILENFVGWVIFVVIDIVFVLGVLVFLGICVLVVFKVFLLVVVIIDDLGVIIIIVIFYMLEFLINVLIFLMFGFVVVVVLNWMGV